MHSTENVHLDKYKYFAIPRDAYYLSFTRKNIGDPFSRAGLRACVPKKLLNTAHPKDTGDLGTLVSPENLLEMFESKRIEVRVGILASDV